MLLEWCILGISYVFGMDGQPLPEYSQIHSPRSACSLPISILCSFCVSQDFDQIPHIWYVVVLNSGKPTSCQLGNLLQSHGTKKECLQFDDCSLVYIAAEIRVPQNLDIKTLCGAEKAPPRQRHCLRSQSSFWDRITLDVFQSFCNIEVRFNAQTCT